MGIFRKLLVSNKKTINTENEEVSVQLGGRLYYNLAGNPEYGSYLDGYARYENGIVYNCSKLPQVSDIIIGYYEKNEDGNCIVWDMDHKKKIGMIDIKTGVVTLTLVEIYSRLKKIRPYVMPPLSLTWVCAKVNDGKVIDLDSGMIIGKYDGETIGAAAAFVCLSYEFVQDGKFHNFFYDWMDCTK